MGGRAGFLAKIASAAWTIVNKHSQVMQKKTCKIDQKEGVQEGCNRGAKGVQEGCKRGAISKHTKNMQNRAKKREGVRTVVNKRSQIM